MKKIIIILLALYAFEVKAEPINMSQIVNVSGLSKTYNQVLKDGIQCTVVFSDFSDPYSQADPKFLVKLFSEYVKYLKKNSSTEIDMEKMINTTLSTFNANLLIKNEDEKIAFLEERFEECYSLAVFIINGVEKKQHIEY